MRLSRTHAGAAKAGLFAALLFCATLAGCDNYCLAINSNPGGTSGTGFTCPAPKPTGNVSLSFGSSLAPTSDSIPLRTPHIFVTLRGIEALPAPIAGDDAPEWQELAPQLAARPIQVDLMARAADSCATGPLGATPIPAGAYNQIRLRLVPNPPPNQPATSAPTLDENACGRFAFSCFVAPDATARPLAWDDPPELRIPSARIAGGFFSILPDGNVHLAIELDTRSSIVLSAGAAVRLVPAFFAADQGSCDSTDSHRP